MLTTVFRPFKSHIKWHNPPPICTLSTKNQLVIRHKYWFIHVNFGLHQMNKESKKSHNSHCLTTKFGKKAAFIGAITNASELM